MEISLNTTSFILHYTLEKSLERSAALGFRRIEICGDRPHGWPGDVSKDERKHLLDVAKSLGVKINSLSTGFIYYLQPGFAHWDPRVREEGVSYVKQLVELARDLDASIVTLIPGRILSNVSYDQALKWSIEKLRECARFSSDRDIVLGLENLVNTNEFTNTSERILTMIKEVNDENLGATIDLGHVNVVKEPIGDFIHKVGNLIVNVHVHDNDGTGDAHLQPGKGNVNLAAAIAALKDVGYERCLTLEVAAGWHWDSLEAEKVVKESKRYVESLL